MRKLLIIDGHNLLFQMFFGMPARIVSKDGKPIHGVLGFVGALLKIIKMTSPTHVIALFDGEHPHIRALTDAQYKANRTDYSNVADEQNPFSQLNDIYAALDFLRIRHTEVQEFETDDVIASYAIQFAGFQIVISSFDSDFFQLVCEHVAILRYRGERTVVCGASYVRERFDIPPSLYADLKSLTGDTADNIRGIRGIGIKTAAALLNQFGSLSGIIARADEIARPTLRQSIQDNAERLQRNYAMIKLDGCAPVPFCADDLLYDNPAVTTWEVLRGIGIQ